MNGAAIDGGWYTDVLAFARDTPWLNGPLEFYATYGVVLFALLMILAWWPARKADPATMAAVLWSPVATAVAFGVNDLVKNVFTEVRPCRAVPGSVPLLPCDGPTDWAFPSNHSAVGAAAAIALLIASGKLVRWIGWVAVAAALVLGFSRVYVGAHYPHDVVVGLLLGGVIGLTTIPARRWLAGPVGRWRTSPVAPFLGASVTMSN